MPRDGANLLSDIRVPLLTVVCEPYGRRERYDVDPRGLRAVCLAGRQFNLFTRTIVAIDGSKFKAVNNRDKNFTVAKVAKRIEQVPARATAVAQYPHRKSCFHRPRSIWPIRLAV
jgi:hypothetical protein